MYVSNSVLMSKIFLLLSKIVRKDVAISNLFLMVINFLTNGVQKLPLAENFQKICKTQPNAMEYVIGLTKKHGLDLM